MAIQSFHRAVVARKNALAAPTNTVLPAITGTPDIGETLTCSAGTWTGSPSITYQWKRDGSNIGGETASTYEIESVAGGLSCYVTGTNAGGSTTVRADSGLPRQIYLSGDSLTSSGNDWPPELETLLGAGWTVVNLAFSGDDVAEMEARAQTGCDPYVDKGWGVNFSFEYANNVIGLQGTRTGLETYADLLAFGQARKAAGAVVLATTAPYNPLNDGTKDATQCKIASDLLRSDIIGDGGADGVVEFFVTALTDAIVGNDSIHWPTSFTDPAQIVADKITAMGLVGYCGDIPISVPNYTNLKTYSNPAYVYDPVNPLPSSPTVGHFLHITGGTGWTPGYYYIQTGFDFNTGGDGMQYLYQINEINSVPAGLPAAGSTTGGIYELPTVPSVPP